MKIKIQHLVGEAIFPYLHDIARLRIAIFKEYPYLYKGSFDYEMKYLQSYIKSPATSFILAFDEDKIIGVSTAIPLKDAAEEFKEPFIKNNIDINTIFYFGESVIDPAYRGQGIYKIFFNERETAGRKNGCGTFAFCAVERPDNHPLKPHNYKDLSLVWKHFGYEKKSNLICYLSWQEIGEIQESLKPLIFWLKHDLKNS